jgi:hypothetical protein
LHPIATSLFFVFAIAPSPGGRGVGVLARTSAGGFSMSGIEDDEGKGWAEQLAAEEAIDMEETVRRFIRMNGGVPDQLEAIPHASFVILAGPACGRTVPVDRTPTLIGRNRLSNIPIEDPTMSRIHAIVSFDGEDFRITDNRSPNRTFVNGSVITESVLVHGDKITLGDTVLEFRVDTT